MQHALISRAFAISRSGLEPGTTISVMLREHSSSRDLQAISLRSLVRALERAPTRQIDAHPTPPVAFEMTRLIASEA